MSQVQDIDRGVDAYRDIADVLVNFRHIVARAMAKIHGERWFESVCPPEVFDRLKSRKDEELSIDRYTPEYQDLIDYADFHDLAEMIFMVADVGDLLKRLATSSDTLCNRLEELEVLRCAIATARPLEEPEVERLVILRQGFRNFLKGKVPVPPWDEERPHVITRSQPPPEEPLDAEEPVDEKNTDKERAAADSRTSDEAGPRLTQTIENQSGIKKGEVDEALAAGDDVRILAAIHEDVMDFAEGFYGEFTDRPSIVWETVSDWYAEHRDQLGLSSLEDFYGLVAEYRRRISSGKSSADLEELVSKSHLPELLMDLRDVFLANKDESIP